MSAPSTEWKATSKGGNEASASTTELGEHKTSADSLDFGEAPDGGFRAWFVAMGAACIFFSCLGFANAFGVFQEYYVTHQLQDRPTGDIAWIGSLSTFVQFVVGAVSGPLFDRFGAWIVRPAAILYLFSIMMTSLCRQYWQFMLAQGVLTGLAMGLLQFPAMVAVTQYFDKKRGAALGVAISGSSIGGVVIPIALSKMLNSTSLGFGWSVRIIGFTITPLLALSSVAITSRLPPRTTDFFILAAFKELRYQLIIVSLFFMFTGMFTPLFFIPTYAVTQGVHVTLASYMLAILNAASTFGRIIPGVLADKFGRINMFAVAGLSTGVVIFCMNKAHTTAGLVVYSVVIGFSSGMIISGASAALTVCVKDPRNNGTYMGMGMAMASFAALIGPPANGALVDRYGGFWEVSVFSGAMCLIGGCTTLASKAVTPQGILGRI